MSSINGSNLNNTKYAEIKTPLKYNPIKKEVHFNTKACMNGINKPTQIYNVDESGMPLDFRILKEVAQTGSKKVRYRKAGKKGQRTNHYSSLCQCCWTGYSTNDNL